MPKVTIRPGPVQNLLDYVVKNYNKLEPFCESKEMFVDVQECSDCHRQSYAPGGTTKYECNNYRRVYLIRYLATQVVQTSDVISDHILCNLQGAAELSAASFGGGPGVEVLALMDQLHKCAGRYKLIFDNMDNEVSWEPIYKDLVGTFAKWTKNVDVDPRFLPVDVTGSFSAGEYDVVFISWILSDLRPEDTSLLLDKASGLLRSDGYVVVTDRPEEDLVANVKTCVLEVADWTMIAYSFEYNKNCSLDFPAESKPFGPKYDCTTAYLVARKT